MKNLKNLRFAGIAAAAAFACLSVQATPMTMTFDPLTFGGTGFTSIEHNLSPTQAIYIENGFQLASDGGAVGTNGFGSAHSGEVDYYFGSASLFNDDSSGGITTLSQVGDGAFSLLSMSLASLNHTWTFTPGQEFVTFTGNLARGGTVTQKVALLGNTSFQTVDFFGFTDLISVTWAQSSAGDNALNQFDNIVVDGAPLQTPAEVPEPASIALLGLGLACILAMAHKNALRKG